jgi:hypothetical protein
MGVRWDAVVGRSQFWTEPVRPAPAAPTAFGAALVPVRVLLFGALANSAADRAFTLNLHSPFCVADVIAELRGCCGAELLSLVADTNGSKFNHCRVYVNGEPVEDVAKPVHCAAFPAQVEMILLTAAEGG